MTFSGRVLVVRGAGEQSPAAVTLEQAFPMVRPVANAEGADEAVDVLRNMRAEGATVDLAVIGTGVSDPLRAAQELRRVDDSIGLAFVVEPAAGELLETRVRLIASLRDALVVATDRSPQELATRLREAAAAAARRRKVSRAVDEINRELGLRSADRAPAVKGQSVSESHLAAIVRHVPEAILSVDLDGRIVTLNEAAVTMFGLRSDRLVGASLGDMFGPGSDIGHLAEGALDGTSVAGQELEASAGGSVPMLCAVTAAPVRDHTGDIVGAVLVMRDITEQRRTEDRLRQLQKAQSLATLAGGVAHDFNNLLVTVRSWAQLAAEDPGDPELLATALDKIQTSADRAAELARSMLVYAGRGRFEAELVDVTRLAQEMTELMRGAVEPGLELVLDLADELPWVEGDTTQLRQVLMNLVTNAAEALGSQPGTITVRTRESRNPELWAGDAAAPDTFVVVEVADTGPGIEPEVLERIFEPFFSTKFEGRGLGLAASHGIVQAHGGVLLAYSEPGQGATFRALLPAREGSR